VAIPKTRASTMQLRFNTTNLFPNKKENWLASTQATSTIADTYLK
jgi:hypothetical protein